MLQRLDTLQMMQAPQSPQTFPPNHSPLKFLIFYALIIARWWFKLSKEGEMNKRPL